MDNKPCLNYNMLILCSLPKSAPKRSVIDKGEVILRAILVISEKV